MNIYVKNTKLFNFYIGMAKRIVNKRDAMGNPLLGYVRLSADMQNNTVEIESNDIVSGIRLDVSAADLDAEILEDGSVLLSESICDWLKGAKEPVTIFRNGTVSFFVQDENFVPGFKVFVPVPGKHATVSGHTAQCSKELCQGSFESVNFRHIRFG